MKSVPGKVSGAWVFRDTRLPVATVFENLEDLSVEETMEQFDVTWEQIAAVLAFVARGLTKSAPTHVSAAVDAHSLWLRRAKRRCPRASRPAPSLQQSARLGRLSARQSRHRFVGQPKFALVTESNCARLESGMTLYDYFWSFATSAWTGI
ncbi:MAG: DUF433 domain-containing protein [Bryobacteraceae bacterium]